MKNQSIKPSVTELALKSKNVIVMGVGGGGDSIQAIPVANYLSLLGVENIYIGNVSCQWWTADGSPVSAPDDWSHYIVGPTIFDVNELTDSEPWAPNIVGVKSTSNVNGCYPCESRITDMIPWETFVAGLGDGVVGLVDSLNQVIKERNIDLLIGVDIGSDSFHDGKEVSPPASSLVDFMSLSALLQLNCPAVYGVSGYGCDGEMELDELDVRVSRVMKAGGYLGAYGLTQRDVEIMFKACDAFPDPIEPFVLFAAQGDFGLYHVPVVNPLGRRVRVTPLASVMMFFDPQTMVDQVSWGAKNLMKTKSLKEAEQVFVSEIKQYPETLLKEVVNYIR